VERRGFVVDEGLDRLRRHVAEVVTLTAPELVSGILREVVPEDGGDDLAVLVLRWPGAADEAPTRDATSSRRTFEGEVASVGQARAFVAGCLAGVSQGTREVATLLTSELASNAVLHARSAFDVCVEVARMRVRVEVADRGNGLIPTAPRSDERNGGRGLSILTRLSERWGVEPGVDGANVVWFEVADEHGVEL
jgi:anti-sigma regulatory factor (Ser/Thr protein kinase)